VAVGAARITDAKVSSPLECLAVFAFCLWCTASYLAKEIYAVLRPATVRIRLQTLLEWINHHRDQTIVILSLRLGLSLMATSSFVLVSHGSA
jgi:hypothetical protein